MATKKKQVKRVCKCENCGNEAEMLITCTLEPSHAHEEKPGGAPDSKDAKTGAGKKHVKGKGVCTSCGSEADMWVDL